MKKNIRIAVVQMKVPKSEKEGEKQILKIVKKAVKKPIDILGLPEECLGIFDVKKYNPLNFLSSVAKKYKIYLFGATTIFEDNKLKNRGFLFNRKGILVTSHDKVVLTPIEEKNGFISGKTLKVFNTEFGKMAILVCKDSFHRYAAWFFDQLRRAGADVILIPSYSLNVSKRSIELWVDSLKALSKWFDVYIAASGTIGKNNTEYSSFGHALIICPNRVVLAEGSYNKEQILRATLDVKSLNEIRNTSGSKWQPKKVPIIKMI